MYQEGEDCRERWGENTYLDLRDLRIGWCPRSQEGTLLRVQGGCHPCLDATGLGGGICMIMIHSAQRGWGVSPPGAPPQVCPVHSPSPARALVSGLYPSAETSVGFRGCKASHP